MSFHDDVLEVSEEMTPDIEGQLSLLSRYRRLDPLAQVALLASLRRL